MDISILVLIGFTALAIGGEVLATWLGRRAVHDLEDSMSRQDLATRNRIKELGGRVNDLQTSASRLHDAWRRAIAICAGCGKVMFTTDKSKSIMKGNTTTFYCQKCKDVE